MIRFTALLIAVLFAGTVQAYIPIAANGDPPPFPERLELPAPGYNFVGGAAAYAACAPDGTLRLSAYAIRLEDGTQGHTVFRIDREKNIAVELKEYRPDIVTRGWIGSGHPLTDCGVDGVLSIVIREKPGMFYLHQTQ